MIHVNDLDFRYTAAPKQTLVKLNFSVRKGEVFGFLGPSGAGKSTTQKILIGLLKDYQGGITVFGRDLKSWKSDYYEKIGVSFEFPNHFLRLTALENLQYFRSLYSSETEESQTLLEMVNLGNDGNLLTSHYSKGMKVRLTVARSLLNKPELIFMDEPTAGIDPVNAKLIKDIIRRKQSEGKTIFLSTHNMTDADELCDRVAFIVDGKIRLIDSPRELKLRYGKRIVRVEYHIDNRIERKEFPLAGLGDNQQFLQLIRERDIQTIHTQETTLENIFIQVTGRSLS